MLLTIGFVLAPWSNFYVMTGSSAGALTGLMFVVITLVRRVNRQNTQDGMSTFSTPTVVHFCVALLVSAILSAPWRTLHVPAILLGLTGLGGVAYIARVIDRTKRLTVYNPDVEDWAWYTISPLIAYGAILASGIMLLMAAIGALFVTAAGVMLLIFTGIRNAWDVVTYITLDAPDEPPATG